MTDRPQLARVSVTVRCTTKLRRAMSKTFSNIGQMGRHPTPEQPLLDAITEMARLSAIFVVDDQARAAFARGRTVGAGQVAQPLSMVNAAAYHGDIDGDLEP